MEKIVPPRLKRGDVVRVIAPALSMSIIAAETRFYADENFKKLGLKLQFGKHVEESDKFNSSSIASRVSDLHDAFADSRVKAIFAVIGGFNSNQLLEYIDWGLIKNNPKIFCGYSDITALQNAILAKTGLVTYSGPVYSTFGQKILDEYSIDNFKKCLFTESPYRLAAPEFWTDDHWYMDQDNRHPIKNQGYWVLQTGKASGQLIGGNLCTLNLLQGTEYMPSGRQVVLFLEDDDETNALLFDRDMQSLLQTGYFSDIRGLVIGKFKKASRLSMSDLALIIASNKRLKGIPIIANVDFGHTDPRITFPIGGKVSIEADNSHAEINILEH